MQLYKPTLLTSLGLMPFLALFSTTSWALAQTEDLWFRSNTHQWDSNGTQWPGAVEANASNDLAYNENKVLTNGAGLQLPMVRARRKRNIQAAAIFPLVNLSLLLLIVVFLGLKASGKMHTKPVVKLTPNKIPINFRGTARDPIHLITALSRVIVLTTANCDKCDTAVKNIQSKGYEPLVVQVTGEENVPAITTLMRAKYHVTEFPYIIFDDRAIGADSNLVPKNAKVG